MGGKRTASAGRMVMNFPTASFCAGVAISEVNTSKESIPLTLDIAIPTENNDADGCPAPLRIGVHGSV